MPACLARTSDSWVPPFSQNVWDWTGVAANVRTPRNPKFLNDFRQNGASSFIIFMFLKKFDNSLNSLPIKAAATLNIRLRNSTKVTIAMCMVRQFKD